LTEKFGARGAELGKVFDLTGDQIREAGKDIGNAITDEDVAAAEELRRAWDEVEDTLAALNNTIQRKLVPGWAALIGGVKLLSETLEDNAEQTDENIELDKAFYDALRANETALYGNATAAKQAHEQYTTYSQKAYDATQKTVGLSKATSDMGKIVDFAVKGQLGGAYKDFATRSREIEIRAGELRAEIEKLTKQGFSPNGKKITELKNELNGLNGEYSDALAQMQKVTAEMIYQQAVASGLAGEEGLLELSRALGLISENDYNLIIATEKLNDVFAKKDDPEGYTKAMMDLYDAAKDGVLTLEEIDALMKSLDGSSANLSVHTNYTSSGSPPPVNPGAGKKSSGVGGGTGGGEGGPQMEMAGPQGMEGGFSGGPQVSGGGGSGVYIAAGAIVINGAGMNADAIAEMVLIKIRNAAETERRAGIGRQ
jgi:hypothetical protein